MYIRSAIKRACQIVCAFTLICSTQLYAQTNIALNKTVTASSQLQAASRAVDGNTHAHWESVHSEAESWLQVDLGAKYKLGTTTIYWDAYNASKYTVQGSNNAIDWVTLATREGGVYGSRIDTINLLGSFRYLRINAKEKPAGNHWGYTIWEWNVTGTLVPPPQVLLFENFDNAIFPTALNVNGPGRQLSTDITKTYGNQGKSLRYVYSAMGTPNGNQYPYGLFDLSSYNTDHVYIRFYAKMPAHTHGLKFVKVFGKRPVSDNYANTTFGLDYTGVASGTGSMYAVSYGDGGFTNSPTGPVEVTANDTNRTVDFVGNSTNSGRAKNLSGYKVTTVQHPFHELDWGTNWHKFEIYVKFNSGTSRANEINDGEVTVKIDGVPYVEATGLFNRHPTNGTIQKIEILGWTQNEWPWVNGVGRVEKPTPEFEIWYDNVEISLNGWGPDPL